MRAFERINERIAASASRHITITPSEEAELEREIDDIICSISRCPNAEAAKDNFDELDSLQLVLAMWLCKYHIPLPKKLREVVGKCDRLDDADLRNYVFDSIKRGTFP